MIIFLPLNAIRTLSQIHCSQVIVRFKEVVNGISHQTSFLLKGTEFLGVNQEMPQLIPVDIFFQSAKHTHDRLPHTIEFFLQTGGNADEHRFQGAEFVW